MEEMYLTEGEEEGENQGPPAPETSSVNQNGSTSPPKEERKTVEVTEILRQHGEAEGSIRDEGEEQEEWAGE